MKLRIIVVGRIKNRALQELAQDYLSRISHYAKIEVVELRDSYPGQEGRQMLEKAGDDFLIALSEAGKEFSSQQFADRLGKINKNMVLVIGGPVGLSEEVKQKAHLVLSLSPMTLPHELARVVLLEQVYRAMTILKGEKYHK